MERKVLLICAGGMSTGILMRKMEKYAEEQGISLKIEAVGMSAYEDVYKTMTSFCWDRRYLIKRVKSNKIRKNLLQ